ncbi:hypothetical protein [Curtobacterium sp. Leaf261]|uniref:hypothetical protein n=1 Tax=Curtobacterium sp. Leaf261 TaxID=1736311 RepID=UPI0006FB62DE|nr:hypothetical protein [Curtobacterium sp. Leaf261]KQO64818.1 hypothetical protein ASF23_01085 [Curtobacterium sp. Leaf261]
MIETVDDTTWFVKRSADASPEAIIDRFGGGFRLRRFSLAESRRTQHGVFVSADAAETAWWRLRQKAR